jgi:hypothetical protein
MLHTRFYFNGQIASDHKLILDDVELRKVQRYAKDREGSVIPLHRIEEHGSVECVAVRGAFDLTELAQALTALTKLEYLSIPSKLIGVLSVQLAPTLQTLEIIGTKNTRLRREFHCSTLKRIMSWPCVTTFCQEQIPMTQSFYTRLDAKGELLKEIARSQNIDVLTISDRSDLAGLPKRDWTDVQFLRLQVNSICSMAGIEQFANVTDLVLHDNKKLASLEGIEKMERLKELTIAYCPALTSLDPLQGLHLQKLSVYGCPQLRKDAAECLAGMGLIESILNINGQQTP